MKLLACIKLCAALGYESHIFVKPHCYCADEVEEEITVIPAWDLKLPPLPEPKHGDGS